MKKGILFFATTGLLALTAVAGLRFLIEATQVSKDFTNASTSNVYTIETARIDLGQAEVFRLDGIPFVVWRRDLAQKVQAVELLVKDLGEAPETLEKVLQELQDTGHLKTKEGDVLRLEWFVVSPINTGGLGCIVTPNAGDFGGFLDPCQDVHFDLWGRARAGPTDADLQVLPYSMSKDGRFISVDLEDAPQIP